MTRSALAARRLVPLIVLLMGGACGESEDPAGGEGGAGGTGGTGGARTDGGGQAGAGAQPPDDGSDPNDPFACTGPGQCLLRDAEQDCCVASCGEQTIDFFAAIHYVHAGTWHEGQICAGCLEPCSSEDARAFTTSTSGIIAVCEEGRCAPLDTRVSEVTACTTSDDCQLRWGSQCCEDRNENLDILTAVSDRDLLKTLTCKEEFTPCGARPYYPSNAHPVCGANGHCEVVFDAPDGGDASAEAGQARGTDASDGAEAGQAAGADASGAADAP